LAVETRDARFIEHTRAQYPLHSYQRLARLMHTLRAVKSDEEVRLLRAACDITDAGFQRVARFVKPGVNETEVEAEFAHEFIRHRCRFAYLPTIASGPNACALHYMTKLNYTVLSVLFAALLLLAPAIFSFFSSPQPSSSQGGEDAVAFVGKLGLFITTAGFMVGAVIGQLVTVGLAVAEIQFRGYINDPTMIGFLALLLAAVVGTLLYAYKSARSYLDQMQPEEDTRRDVESILAKVASGHRLERFDWNGAPELTSPEKKTLDHLVKKHGPAIPKWNMF